MARVVLVHWKEAELAERVERLVGAGHAVDAWHEVDGAKVLRALGEDPPDVLVIDLGRLPSHGREVGVAVRTRKSTRAVPLVFVDGAKEKVERVRAVLPDAEYVTWRGIRGAITRATKARKRSPVVPSSNLAAYAGTPLPKKLGIRAGSSVALLGAPQGFDRVLRPLPDGVTIRRDARARTDLTLCFVRSTKELEGRIARLVPRAVHGGLWLVWPKRTSALAGDLTQQTVRRIGLAAGLVDFKVAAVDATWSGLRFTQRETASGRGRS